MRTPYLLLCTLLLAGAHTGPAKAQSPGFEASAMQYFKRQLADGPGTGVAFDHPGDKGLKASQVQAAREQVWRLWCEASDGADEEKLIAARPLEDAPAGAWNLPESLEPHARMPYYYATKGERPANGYPLFLYLHGSGAKANEWSAGLRLCLLFDDAPSLYFIPQIPNEGEWYRWYQRSKQYAWEKLIRQALASGMADADRIYLLGISEGGYGSQRLASFYADYLAAAGPMAGGEPLKNAPAENCGNMAFSLLTGAQDKGFYRDRLTYFTQLAFDSLALAYPGRYTHRICLIPERGHHIDYRPTTPWLSAFRRTPCPAHYVWEDFPMDGRYRNGFHNIRVDSHAPLDGKRMMYKMDIEDNVVDIEVSDVAYTTTSRDSVWGIELKFAKQLSPARQAAFTVFLNEELIDMKRPVRVVVNGKDTYNGRVRPSRKALVESCALFYDPRRLFPVAIPVRL